MGVELEVKDHAKWEEIVDGMATSDFALDAMNSKDFFEQPQQLLNRLSYFKYVAKLVGSQKDLLLINPEEGLSCLVLQQETKSVSICSYSEEHGTKLMHDWNNISVIPQHDLVNDSFGACCFLNFEDTKALANVKMNIQSLLQLLKTDGHFVIGCNNHNRDEMFSILNSHFKFTFEFSLVNEVLHIGDLAESTYRLLLATQKK